MGKTDFHADENLTATIIRVAQVVNLALVVGGIAFAIWTIVRAQYILSTYIGPVDGDIRRGFYIGVIGGLLTSFVTLLAFIGIARRHMWGAVLDTLFWIAVWWPIGFGASALTANGYAISTVACGLGAALGIAVILALKYRRSTVQQSTVHALPQD